MDIIPDYELGKCIDKYNGAKGTKKFSCRDQFKVMSFTQLTGMPSFRIVEATLTMFSSKLYHAGMKLMHKSTLAKMNEKKLWLIYRDFAYILIERGGMMYVNDYFRLGDLLRLATYEDFEDGKVYQFLTNDFTYEALTIPNFTGHIGKWSCSSNGSSNIFMSFFGVKESAIYTQILIAVCVYLIFLIVRKVYQIEQDLYIFSQAVGLILFENIPLSDIFKRN